MQATPELAVESSRDLDRALRTLTLDKIEGVPLRAGLPIGLAHRQPAAVAKTRTHVATALSLLREKVFSGEYASVCVGCKDALERLQSSAFSRLFDGVLEQNFAKIVQKAMTASRRHGKKALPWYGIHPEARVTPTNAFLRRGKRAFKDVPKRARPYAEVYIRAI